jgi:hypothetical protein
MSTVFQALANRRRHRSQEQKDMQARKVRLGDIERLRRTMQTVPEHQTEEVTMAEAVRMLSPEIEAMKAKGYSLSAIAAHLSDNGLALTMKTLKAYVGEARAGGVRKKRSKPKAHRPAIGAAAITPTTEAKAGVVAGGASAGAKHPARVNTKTAPRVTAPSTATATPATQRGTMGTTRPDDEAAMQRSAFVPKEDTRDI